MTEKRTIRLSILGREFNLGIHDIVDFLHSKGYDNIPVNPNTRITHEQYLALLNEFKDNNKTFKVHRDSQTQKTDQSDEVRLIGKIDLTSLNAKVNLINENRNSPKIDEKKKPDKNVLKRKDDYQNNDSFLQDIWQIHTDVQEQMLRLRSAPVSIIPESARIVGEKLFLTLDENDKTGKIIEEIVSLFQITVSEINLEKRYLYVDSIVSHNLSRDQKRQLSKRAAANFIKIHPQPVIDGYFKKKSSPISSLTKLLEKSRLDYSFDSNGRLQISINDLNKLENTFNHKGISLIIPEVASVILQLSPNLHYYLSKEFPKVFKHNCDNINVSNVIITKNSYFSEPIYEFLNKEIGLNLTWYKFIFRVNAEVLDNYNPKSCPYELPELNKDDNSFCFYVNIEKDYSDNFILFEEEKFEFNLKYTRLKKFFNSFFGAHNISFQAVFNYSFDNKKFDSIFFEQIQNSLFDNISFSESTMSIGIDFNWKVKQIDEIISELQFKYPFVHFGLYRNHRCNIDFKIQDLTLDEVENLLREKFPSIQTRRNDREGNLYFFQEYQTQEQSIIIRDMINSELDEFDTNAFDFGLYEIPNNKEKYIITIDNQSKRESLVAAVKELRGTNFCIGKNDFGKLFRVNYPEMIFDISGDNFEQTKQVFESK
ncbi:MAG: hypothetical protein PHY85_07155, partial [Bacteroidales bacterium]|nr:hypothetical protein [Bacteroidales bacterium]